MHKKALACGERLPVAIVDRGAPGSDFCQLYPGAEGKELAYAAELLGGKIRVRECSNGVLAPADAEIVLEGYIGADVTDEGPFVDITGTYDPVRLHR